MSNPIFDSPNQASSLQNNDAMRMFNILKNSNNPQQAFIQMLNQNPQLKNIYELVSTNGGNAEQLFYTLAKQKNTDPNEILSMFK